MTTVSLLVSLLPLLRCSNDRSHRDPHRRQKFRKRHHTKVHKWNPESEGNRRNREKVHVIRLKQAPAILEFQRHPMFLE
ncbi:hypothetical protein QR685DRAFT_196534 [Neurospora intermedia]|uniref:Secreted protein n=1 Tax=Neurospora intermedia TaxID=5142 RepID=A0ABR3DNB8_NEUIN